MKKYLIPMFMCVICLSFILTGCGFTPLENSPKTKSNMVVNGTTLVYDDYIYFANSFVDYSTLTAGQNNAGAVDNQSIFRIKTTNNLVSYNEDTGLPENLEKAVSKIAGYAYSYMFSVGEFIYFASPSTHKNDQNATTFNLNSYFRVNTDGSGLIEFYTSQNSITQQQILTINNVPYLFVVDGSKLVKFTLGTTIQTTVLKQDFTSIVLPTENNSEYAYYLTGLTENDTESGKTEGSYLYKLNLITGEVNKNSNNEDLALNSSNPAVMTLKLIHNNKLYFTIKESNTQTYFAYLTTGFNNVHITEGIDASTITDFYVITAENNKDYYIFVSSDTSKTYLLVDGETKNFSTNELLTASIDILFTSGNYIYYSIAETGIYRISVQSQTQEQISDKTDFKTDGISFDGNYIYFYAKNTDNTTGTYYMHRADAKVAERSGVINVELLSLVLEDDEPEDEEE